jgi:choline dehydrogenase-like flavoprotein
MAKQSSLLHDAVIVGAGPAGLLVYEQLTAAGFNTVLLEAGTRVAGKIAPVSDPAVWTYRSHRRDALEWLRTHAVGGRTVGWGGLCFRFPDVVFEKGGWPYGARTLAPYYRTAEAWLGVVEGRLHEQHRRVARRLGRPIMPLRGARREGKVWIAGHAAGARAARVKHVACAIACNGGHAVAVRVRRRDGEDHWMRARSFVLAAGPIESARLLLASGLDRAVPRLGRGLVRHPTVSYMLVEPYPAPAAINPHDLLDGALVPFAEHGYAVEIVGPLPMAEAMHGELKERGVSGSVAANMRVTHVNAMTETEPNGASSVTLSRTDVDALGRAVPVIRLVTTRKDRESIARMKASCVAIAEAIAQPGAELLLIEEPAPNRYLFHEAGTCVMGVGAEAPCTPWGRLRAVDNVWIADASVFPSAGDRHPTLTVLAHALRVARDMQRHLPP